jgi:hypothetical protein
VTHRRDGGLFTLSLDRGETAHRHERGQGLELIYGFVVERAARLVVEGRTAGNCPAL